METKKCIKCGVELIVGETWFASSKNYCRYVCKKCSAKRVNDDAHKRGVKSVKENKECASYLGCHVAERVLSNVFKDVEVMPYGNPGYDFICNKGKKIDVKSGCIIYKENKSPCWTFKISRNKTADYFLCIAFDNRENLTPLHLWLLPSRYCRDKITCAISESTIFKWDEYRIDVTKVTECCNKIRGGNESGLGNTEDFGGC
jgi:hypothetical protein